MRSAALALSITVAASCIGYDAGIEVDVVLSVPRATSGDGIEAAILVVEDVELLPCAMASVLPALSTARAHGDGGESGVFDLRDGGSQLSTLRPAPGHYCTLRLHLGDAQRNAFELNGVHAPRQDVDISLEDHAWLFPTHDALVVHFDYKSWAGGELAPLLHVVDELR